MKTIIAIPGSLRRDSINLELLKFINEKSQNLINISITPQTDLDLPIFNQDNVIQSDLNLKLIEYKKLLNNSDGILISSPEYNGSISGALKNFIDWLSRDYNPFFGKKIGLMTVSTSSFGGIRSLMHLRDIMLHMGAFVYPGNICLSKNNAIYSEQQLNLINDFSRNFFNFIS